MQRLRIPDSEKEKGLVWVEYPVVRDNNSIWDIIAMAELEIRQKKDTSGWEKTE